MALGLSLILTPACQKLAQVAGFLDVPKGEQHKLHAKSTPLLGGVAMFLSWMLTILAGFAAVRFILPQNAIHGILSGIAGMHLVSGEFMTIGLCALGALALGTWDDKKALPAGKKLIGQIVIAVLTVTFGGVHITLFMDLPVITWAISAFWIIFIFNSINFFDNMDGLAVGTASIAFLFFTAAAIVNEQYFVACLGACCAGSSIGFWFFNHSPASIFMGDGGSHFLGYMLAVVSAKVTYFNPDITVSHLSILIPLFILAVPIFDTLAVVVIRLYHHKPIYVGDHNHISHRFLHMGMTRKRSVLLVHILCLIAGLGAMPILWGDEKSCILLLTQGCAILLLLTLIQYSGSNREEASNGTR